MSLDTRIATSLPAHPKTKKLVKRLGDGAAWKLVCLFLWASANRSDGVLTGMSVEDIELAVDWSGEDGKFVSALADVGFLDCDAGIYSLHDWTVHNPWAAGADARSEKAKWAALCKHEGREVAASKMPEYANRVLGADSGYAKGVPLAESSSAPSPSPSPSPKSKESPADAEAQSAAEKKQKRQGCTLQTWIDSLGGEDAIPEDDPIYAYADSIGLPDEYISLAWSWFKAAMASKRQKDWRSHFRNAVRGNWPKYWWPIDGGGWRLSPAGEQAKRAMEAKAA